MCFNIASASDWSKYLICIDPGHGGKDRGVATFGMPSEAELTMRCALQLESRIKSLGGKVELSRHDDSYVSLISRALWAQSKEPWIFSSIHLASGGGNGTKSYYYWPNSSSSNLAEKVQNALVNRLKQISGYNVVDHGTEMKPFTVLMGHMSQASSLVEAFYGDNKAEWEMIKSYSSPGFREWVWGMLYGYYDYIYQFDNTIDSPEKSKSDTNFFEASDISITKGGTVVLPIKMVNTNDITAFQLDIKLPSGLTVDTNSLGEYDIAMSTRVANHRLYVEPQNDGSIRVLVYSPDNSPIEGSEGDILFVTLKASNSFAKSGQVQIIENILVDTNIDGSYAPSVYVAANYKSQLLGNANGDDRVNLQDVVTTTDHILNNAERIDTKLADINEDGVIDISDAIGIGNLIINNSKADIKNNEIDIYNDNNSTESK